MRVFVLFDMNYSSLKFTRFILHCNQTGIEYNVEPNGTTIGRNDTNNIVLEDPAISRLHALIWEESDLWYIRDCNSSNGIHINGVKIEPDRNHKIIPGDIIALTTGLSFRFLETDDATVAVPHTAAVHTDSPNVGPAAENSIPTPTRPAKPSRNLTWLFILIPCLIIAVFVILIITDKSEPVDYTIGAMHYQLSDKYRKEKDQDRAKYKYDETVQWSFSEDGDYYSSDDYLSVQWFEGPHKVSVIAVPVPFNNDEYEMWIRSSGAWYIWGDSFKQFSVDDAEGRYGTDQPLDKSYTNTKIDLLKDGIYYQFVFFNEDDLDEDMINDLISSISFEPDLIKNKTIPFEDISIELSGYYQELSVDKEDGYLAESAYGVYGDEENDILLICEEKPDGVTLQDYIDYVKGDIPPGNYTETSEQFGPCLYYSETGDGRYTSSVLFETNGRFYQIILISENHPISIDEIQKIAKTVKQS